MANSTKLTDLLETAMAKASSLSPSEQDEIARQILARVGDSDWGPIYGHEPSAFSRLGALLKSLRPKNEIARAIVLPMCLFVLFVQAPLACSWGSRESSLRSLTSGPTAAIPQGSVPASRYHILSGPRTSRRSTRWVSIGVSGEEEEGLSTRAV